MADREERKTIVAAPAALASRTLAAIRSRLIPPPASRLPRPAGAAR